MVDRGQAPDTRRLERLIDDIVAEMTGSTERGETADYIPEIAGVDVEQFGLALVTCEDQVIAGGDADQPFTLQSISKVFSLALALEAFGDDVWERVGREPSGDPFNSITDLETQKGYPRNPFINPGALIVIDMLLDRRKADGVPDFVRERIVELIGGEKLEIDEHVVRSEESANYTNRALANLAKAYGNLKHEVDDVMAAYVRQCAIRISCRQLALAGRFLIAERETSPSPAELEDERRARRIGSLMLTCGQYDGSGNFAYRVGLPAKSGISGGILAIVPNVASIAVWCPGLDENGNSLLGTLALERLSEGMDWSVFGATRVLR